MRIRVLSGKHSSLPAAVAFLDAIPAPHIARTHQRRRRRERPRQNAPEKRGRRLGSLLMAWSAIGRLQG